MQLEQFVEDSLTQLMAGVKNAQRKADEFGATINPRLTGATSASTGTHYHNKRLVVEVAFDVALTSETGEAARGGIGVLLGAINVGGGYDEKATQGTVSRIQFTVPLVFPET